MTTREIVYCLAVFIGTVIADLMPIHKSNKHECEFPNCPYKGDVHFTHGCGSCAPGSDCRKLDSVHFLYPKLSYDECEVYLKIQ